MAQTSSFDITSEFDFQELRNAVDQTRKEVLVRYDFKGVRAEVDLQEDKIVLITTDDFKLEALKSMLLQKIINRKLSPKVLKWGKLEHASLGGVRQEAELVKVLNSEQTKQINKLIHDNFPKVKTAILGEEIRVSSASRDELQAIISFLRGQEKLEVALQFGNYR